MQRFEYSSITFDFGDLEQLNRFSQAGWRVAAVVPSVDQHEFRALLERPIADDAAAGIIEAVRVKRNLK